MSSGSTKHPKKHFAFADSPPLLCLRHRHHVCAAIPSSDRFVLLVDGGCSIRLVCDVSIICHLTLHARAITVCQVKCARGVARARGIMLFRPLILRRQQSAQGHEFQCKYNHSLAATKIINARAEIKTADSGGGMNHSIGNHCWRQ